MTAEAARTGISMNREGEEGCKRGAASKASQSAIGVWAVLVVAYRIYYTTFYDSEHETIKKKIKEMLNIEPIDHKSRIPGFRYIEVRRDEGLPGSLEEEIARIVKAVLGPNAYVRVDYIKV